MSSRFLGLFFGILAGVIVLGAMYFSIPKPTPTTAGPVAPGPGEPVIAPGAVAADTQPTRDKPIVKLAVLIVFDQLRGDYPEKWKSIFGSGGFRRMQTEGKTFTNCYYPYGITSTGPGHASVLSGCSPDKHGITNNDWYDRATSSTAYCAGTERHDFVPGKVTAAGKLKNAGTPDRMLSPTVADVLKLATGGKSKVFGLSLKDRSAILPVGHKPDGAYWFDGKFITSTFYREALHPWVAEFNRSKLSDQWFETSWTKFRPDLDYLKHTGPDEMLGEAKLNGRGNTFPHTMTGGKKELGKEYYEALANSPHGNDLLLALTKACIVAEGLGTRETPDLLAVSFSSNDLVGHTFGPDSHEVLDITLRSDALLADFLGFLDEKIGKANYVVAITADHGICPLPELSAAIGREGKRVPAVSLLLQAERHLQSRFGKLDGGFDSPEQSKRSTWIETISAPWLYVNERLCAAKGVSKEAVAAEYVAWLRQQPDVQNAYTAKELIHPESLDEFGKLMAKSYYPGRSGDVGVVLRPYDLIDSKVDSAGTNHGSPHDYDRLVPLMVLAPGVAPGESKERVVPQHAATVLSHYLGLTLPRDCEYTLPKELLKK